MFRNEKLGRKELVEGQKGMDVQEDKYEEIL